MPEPFDPQSLNRYSYVRNSPTNRIDPTGHFDFWGLADFFTAGMPNFFTDTLLARENASPKLRRRPLVR